ncbi:XTP/dITP diphosphatase [Aquibacillus sp. 3ASR75-11]|uniref:dITP/XTP pyrophosphatase n=1 Tax=Terrihalobacillus insolitus TaxID=2950438 RepID=A0A9X3WSL9_9BACI|nr:XTP/dITP diphosphatase [Terrihalobacillus insolitus]MDC3423918.1 XTP/dITP diphosphatase [Terrihalobacillus insolitus]
MKKIMIATKNEGKVKEFKQLFLKYGVDVISLLDMEEDIPDVEETGTTFEQNAALKAETISAVLNIPVIADDSGLEIRALEGRPGVYSARYAGTSKNDRANLDKVLTELTGVPDENRMARFVCVIAVAQPGKSTFTKRGTCEGKIGLHPTGKHGFGYDPIFIPNEYNRTMAQLSADEKNAISHRRNALSQLEDWLRRT